VGEQVIEIPGRLVQVEHQRVVDRRHGSYPPTANGRILKAANLLAIRALVTTPRQRGLLRRSIALRRNTEPTIDQRRHSVAPRLRST
jgi:hypothetical protein